MGKGMQTIKPSSGTQQRLGLVALCSLFGLLAGCAAPKSNTITAFRTYDIPPSVSLQTVVKEVKSAMEIRAHSLNAITTTVPDRLPAERGLFK